MNNADDDGTAEVFERLVEALAEELMARLARQTIRSLQRLHTTLSGDDSGLNNAWDEICVQVQGEESFDWQTYVETIDQQASYLATPLSPNQKRALWLQTQEGLDWLRENDREPDAANVPFDDLAIAELIRARVLDLAESYSNHRIDRYLDAGSELDRG